MFEMLIPTICVESAEKFARFKFTEGFIYGFLTTIIIVLLLWFVKIYFDDKFKEIANKKN